jgi:hypothetical protein
MLAGSVVPWTVVRSGRPAFPFVVDRVARQAAAQASAQIDSNRRNVTRLLTNPQLIKGQLMVAMGEHGLDPSKLKPESLSALSKYFQDFCARGRNFYDDGTLCIVGFGNGDHDSREGDIPVGPNTLRKRLFTSQFTSWLGTLLNP